MIAILRKFFAFCSEDNRNKFYRSLVLGVIMSICESVKFPAIYIILIAFVNDRISNKTILLGFLLLLFSVIVETFARARSAMLQCRGGYRECANKRIQIAEHLRFLPMGYFNSNSLGEITSVATNTMEQLGDVATRVVMLTTQGILNTAIIVALIPFFDWRIGIICVSGIILFSLVNIKMRNSNISMYGDKMDTDATLVSCILEYVQGISEVKSYNLVGNSRKKLDDAIKNSSGLNTALELAANRYIPVQDIILKLTEVCIALASINFYLNGSMDIVTVIVMIVMSFHIFTGLAATGAYSALLRIVDICVDKGRQILEIEPMDISGSDYHTKKQDIVVSGIDFAYDQKKIIDNISLTIPEKSSAAFVGPSGGGKTTLCHLIARFWDVQNGGITLDGKNVKEYSMNSLMENFSFVFQNVYLFHDTIANNIRFGTPDAPIDKVIDAAKKACCHDFIMRLPDGYDTVIGENGASLSGGERQRISIARAIMKDAPVIILDEATSNVDPENEKELMTAIEELTKEKTVLMIAHRLKTVRDADQIFVIDKGRIASQGTHMELMRQDGIYQRFVDSRKQAIGWKL